MDPVKFVKETRRELGKVTWPTRKEIIQMTGLVIIVSLVVAIYIGILDVVMSKILETLLK
jgi:preprotein translocase subunit SecE